MVFYHNSLLQILGSMGLMGLAAYGTLLWGRVRLLLRGGEAAHLVGLFYLGMQLTSLTNPGLFCPLPSAMLTVLAFAVLERYMDDPASCRAGQYAEWLGKHPARGAFLFFPIQGVGNL